MPAIRKNFCELSAVGLQTNDFRCLKRKNRKEWFKHLKNIPLAYYERLRSHLNNKTVTVIVARLRMFWNVGKVPTVFHCFCLFTFKNIHYEVNNLLSTSRGV